MARWRTTTTETRHRCAGDRSRRSCTAALRHGRTTEVAHGLRRHSEVDRLLEVLRVTLPDLTSKVWLQAIDVMVHLVGIAHIDDRREGGLEHAGV